MLSRHVRTEPGTFFVDIRGCPPDPLAQRAWRIRFLKALVREEEKCPPLGELSRKTTRCADAVWLAQVSQRPFSLYLQ